MDLMLCERKDDSLMFCLGTGKEITHYVIGYQELTFESVEMKIRDVKFKFLFIHFSFLFERETEKDLKEKQGSSITGSLPKSPQQPGLDQVIARSQEFSLGLSGWQVLSYLSHHQDVHCRKLQFGENLELKPQYSTIG